MNTQRMNEEERFKEEAVKSFKDMQLFWSFTDKEINDVVSKARIRKFRKNRTVLSEDDTNHYMYIILKGRVKVVQMTEDGKEVILAVHRSGESFGEVSLIDGKTIRASVVAIEDSVIADIAKKDYIFLVMNNKKMLENLLSILCVRLRESWDKIQMLSLASASARMKMLLQLLSEEHGRKTPEGVAVNIRLTHQDIANMTGISRETVTRIMDKWHKDGEIGIIENRRILLKHDFIRGDLKWINR